jgi:ankyrin repeat protein
MFRLFCCNSKNEDEKKNVLDELMRCIKLANKSSKKPSSKLLQFNNLGNAVKAVAEAKRISDLNKPNDAYKPLHYIAKRCEGQVWLIVMRDLLKLGVDPNVPDQKMMAPLNYALEYQDTGMADILLEHKADLEFKTTKNQTVLLKFIVGSQEFTFSESNTLFYLLSHGADMTAVDDAMQNMFHLLAMHWTVIPKSADEFFRKQDKEKIRQLLESKDENGNTPLHIACSATKLPLFISSRLEYYLSLYRFVGADFSIPNHAGFPPIFLLLDQMDELGWTATNECIETFFEMEIDCFETTMLTYIDGRTKQVTPLEYARLRELPAANEAPQESKEMKPSEKIVECMNNKKFALSWIYEERQQKRAFLMGRHERLGAGCKLPKLSNPLVKLIFSFSKPRKPDDKQPANESAETNVVRWHG